MHRWQPIKVPHLNSLLRVTHSFTNQCHLSVSINASCQCSSMPPASAHQCLINATYQCLPVHINATYQCSSELPFSATNQCCQSVPPISASQCRLSVPISDAYQCRLTVPVNAT
ncbi:unnamed protein product [Staurois parvus]|uniref:Uncharacterized protein n=1 Tax=Staurois parvus TaxID=386267 RepID=A0ABN9AIV5_9NEOB|nr:unnamed protein product [Staurois parvus]